MFKKIVILIVGVCMAADGKGPVEFDHLWNFSDPAGTEKKFQELVPSLSDSKNKDHLLQLMTQIARTQGLQRKFEVAHKTLDALQKLLDSQTPVAEVRYFLERGRVFNSSKKADEALPLFVKAFELATARHQDNFAVDAAHMIAIAEKDSAKQMEWNLKAIAIAEKSKEPKARDWMGSLYNNVGWTYHDAGKFEEALAVFQKALAFRETKGEDKSIRIAKWSVARTYRSLKKYTQALEIQTVLEKENEKLGTKDAYVFEELGELYLVQNQPDLSKKYFALAFIELSKDEWFIANEAARLNRIKELGKVP